MDLSDRTSLYRASLEGHESVVRALVEMGVDIHAKDNEYPNVISECSMNSLPVMNLRGGTSLHAASQNGHESVVRALVELGADIDAKDN